MTPPNNITNRIRDILDELAMCNPGSEVTAQKQAHTQILNLLKEVLEECLPNEHTTIYGGVRRPDWDIALAKDNGYKEGFNYCIDQIKANLQERLK